MNEHEISSHVSENSKLHIVQPEFSTWKYKVKLSAEAVSRGFYKRICSENFRNVYRKTTVLEFLFNKVAGLQDLTTSAALCIKYV